MSALISQIENFGMILDHQPILDGTIHRCKMMGCKGEPGFYVGWLKDGYEYAKFGTWHNREDDQKYTSNDTNSDKTETQWRELALIQRMTKEQDQERASERAKRQWMEAEDCPPDHPYLTKKGVQAHGVRLRGEQILIPMYDQTMDMLSVQTIAPDGKKRFLYNGKKNGCCYPVVGNKDIIFITEGFATGATIQEVTGHHVLVAFDAGNLVKIATTARNIYGPKQKIIIAADNDHTKKTNAGITYGKKAAEAINSRLVYPDNILGSDFNDMAAEKDFDATRNKLLADVDGRVEILTADDISEQDNMTLNIAEHILNPGGIFSDGIKGLSQKGMPKIDQYSFPVIAAAIANALAGRVVCKDVWPNIYCIKVGPTSSGKSVSDKEIRLAVKDAGLKDFYGMTDIASGQALYRGLEQTPQTMIVLDEATALLRRYNKADPIADSKRDALLDIYSSSGQEINKVYGNRKNSIHIDNPCLTLTGNATPIIFDAINEDDFTSGLIPRFDFFCYDGKIPYKGVKDDVNRELMTFAAGLKLIRNNVLGDMQDITGATQDIGMMPDCVELLEDYSRQITDKCNNSSEGSGTRGVISRSYDLAIKYAMIHAGGTRPPLLIYEPITLKDLQWGIDVAAMLSEWKIGVLSKKITAGEFHRDCEIFKDAILKYLKHRQPGRPTFGKLSNVKKKLKTWEPQYSKKIITVLRKRDEIILDDSARATAYYLPKTKTSRNECS